MDLRRRGHTAWAWCVGLVLAAVHGGIGAAETLDGLTVETRLAERGPAYCKAVGVAAEQRAAAVAEDPAAALRDDVDAPAAGAARGVLSVFDGASDEALADLGAVTVCDGQALPALVLAAEAGWFAAWYAPGCQGLGAVKGAFERAHAAVTMAPSADAARLVVLAATEALRCDASAADAGEWRRALVPAARTMARFIALEPADQAFEDVSLLVGRTLAATRESRDPDAGRAFAEVIRALTLPEVLARMRQADPAGADRIEALARAARNLGVRPAALANRASLLLDEGRTATADEVVMAHSDLREALSVARNAEARSEILLRLAALQEGSLGASLGSVAQRAVAAEQLFAEVLRTDPAPPPGAVDAWARAMGRRLALEGEGLSRTESVRRRLTVLAGAPVPLPFDLLGTRVDLLAAAQVPPAEAIHDVWRDLLARGLVVDACRAGLIARMLGLLDPDSNAWLRREIETTARQSCGSDDSVPSVPSGPPVPPVPTDTAQP